MRQIIEEIDPGAFFIVSQGIRVQGRGFPHSSAKLATEIQYKDAEIFIYSLRLCNFASLR
jgi:hypothetical protein